MFKKTIITLIAAVFVTSCAKKQPAFENVKQAQLQRYPAMQIEDWYKLVYTRPHWETSI